MRTRKFVVFLLAAAGAAGAIGWAGDPLGPMPLVAQSESPAKGKMSPGASRSKSAKSKSPKTSGKQKSSPDPAAGESPASEGAGAWPQFLGPDRNNVSSETDLLKKWPRTGPKLLWTARGFGVGYTAVSAFGELLFTMGNRGDEEFVIALKSEGGAKQWELRTGRAYRESQGDGPRSTPTIDGEVVYALGANGDLVCAGTKTGEVVWRKNILSEFGGNNTTWGVCESVLIDGDRLICTPGGSEATLVALEKGTGNVVWKSPVPGKPSAAYASAIAFEVGGVRQYAQLTSAGIVGVRASDGKPMWGDNHATAVANCSSPVFFNDMVFSAVGYGTGGTMLKLTSKNGETTAKFTYHSKEMKSHHGGYVVIDGHLYGSSDPGILTCIELKSGKVKWQDRSVGKGSITAADGQLICRSEEGPVSLVRATPSGFRLLGVFTPPERSDRPAWPYPVVAYGKLFLRDQEIIQCFDLKGGNP